MDDWGTHLGPFGSDDKKSIENNILIYAKLLANKHVQHLADMQAEKIGIETTIFNKCLTYDEVYTLSTFVKSKDGPPKPKYEYLEPKEKCYERLELGIGKNGAMKYKKGKIIPGKFEEKMKGKTDYVTVCVKNRSAINYLISNYYNCLLTYYVESGYEFPEKSNFHIELLEYMKIVSPSSHAIMSMINWVTPEYLDSVYAQKDHMGNPMPDHNNIFEEKLYHSISHNFMNKNTDIIPTELLKGSTKYISHFIKIIAISMGNYAFDKKKSINEYVLFSFLRSFNSIFNFTQIEAEFTEDTIRMIKSYIEWKPVKEKVVDVNVPENSEPLPKSAIDETMDEALAGLAEGMSDMAF